MSMFKTATKQQAKLRMAIHGPSGAGKTYSALRIGSAMGKRIALIDTERGSASKYSDKFAFEVCEVFDDYNPQRLFDALAAAAAEKFDVVIVDSLTHFWNGPGGFLELVDDEVRKQKARGHKPDSFAAWKSVDALYRRLIQSILATPFHFFGTLRAKTEYDKSEGSNGKTKITKVGMAPEMRQGFEYEFDVEGMLDIDNNLAIGKTRCSELHGRVFAQPGEDVAKILVAWLSDGAPAPAKPPVAAAPPPPKTQPPETTTAAPSAPASEPKPKAIAPAEPALPDNPEQCDALDRLSAALDEAASHAACQRLANDAKQILKGAFLEAFKVRHGKRWRAIQAEGGQVAS